MGEVGRVLLDTHAFLWWLSDDPQLSATARAVIADPDNRVLVSAASAWEIATKVRLGKLPSAKDVVADLEGCIRRERFEELPVTVAHAQRAGGLPGPHKDPFDRILIAQAAIEQVPLVSIERLFERYRIRRLW